MSVCVCVCGPFTLNLCAQFSQRWLNRFGQIRARLRATIWPQIKFKLNMADISGSGDTIVQVTYPTNLSSFYPPNFLRVGWTASDKFEFVWKLNSGHRSSLNGSWRRISGLYTNVFPVKKCIGGLENRFIFKYETAYLATQLAKNDIFAGFVEKFSPKAT